jgi:hypothetical protein
MKLVFHSSIFFSKANDVVKITLANISKLALSAIEKGSPRQIVSNVVESPTQANFHSRMTSASTIASSTPFSESSTNASQVSPVAVPELILSKQFPPTNPVIPPNIQPQPTVTVPNPILSAPPPNIQPPKGPATPIQSYTVPTINVPKKESPKGPRKSQENNLHSPPNPSKMAPPPEPLKQAVPNEKKDKSPQNSPGTMSQNHRDLHRPQDDSPSRTPEHTRDNKPTPLIVSSHPLQPKGHESNRSADHPHRPEPPRDQPSSLSERLGESARRELAEPREPKSEASIPSTPTLERSSRWDIKDSRDPPRPTRSKSKESINSDSYRPQTSNRPNDRPISLPPTKTEISSKSIPSGPGQSQARINTSTALQQQQPPPSLASRINLSLSEKLDTSLSLESTLKITAFRTSFYQLNLQDLVAALRLPNLLHLEIRNSVLYLRLLDSTSAHRVASAYKNYSANSIPLEWSLALNAVKLTYPSDYAPKITTETISAWNSGGRRTLVTSSFAPECRRSFADYDAFVVVVKRLWGYFSVDRSSSGKVFIGFEGIDSAVAGKQTLERKFGEVFLQYSEERGKPDF